MCAGRGICDYAPEFANAQRILKRATAWGSRTRECGFPTGTITACPGEISCMAMAFAKGILPISSAMDGWEQTARLGVSLRAMVRCPHGNRRTAHNLQECSNIGLCERSKGECVCRVGWNGAACQYKSGAPACRS